MMKTMRPWKHKKHKPLGHGATMVQEANHFIHEMGNKIMVMSLRMEVRNMARAERLRLKTSP